MEFAGDPRPFSQALLESQRHLSLRHFSDAGDHGGDHPRGDQKSKACHDSERVFRRRWREQRNKVVLQQEHRDQGNRNGGNEAGSERDEYDGD